MKKLFLLINFCILIFGVCAYADGTPEVYNIGEKVEIEHELLYYDEQYYIHSSDLFGLNLSYEYDETSKNYTIIAKDYLGQESRLNFWLSDTIPDYSIGDLGGVIISPIAPGDFDFGSTGSTFIISSEDVAEDNDSGKIIPHTMNVTCAKRKTEKIGGAFLDDKIEDKYTSVKIVKYNDEYYFPMEYIGENLSHKYSFDNNRFDFYITDETRTIIENTINIPNAVQDVGVSMSIYFAEKIGEGDSLTDFDIIYQKNYVSSPEEDIIHFLFDIPKEKITDESFYYILDLGEQYSEIKNEYDFSEVGAIVVYPSQKYTTYTAKISLPEADVVDVAFTVGVEVDNNYYEQSGVIKKGETSAEVKITGIPASRTYYPYVTFDMNKYVDKYIDEIWLLEESTGNFYSEHIAHKAKEIKCNISLPDGFICEENVEIKLSLGKYNSSGTSIDIPDRLNNGNDSVELILNTETQSAEVILYGNSDELKLYYTIKNEAPGLKKNGYLGEKGWFTQDTNTSFSRLKKITENSSYSVDLLENREMVIKEQTGKFVIEKTNVNFNVLCDVYIAYYDEKNILISCEMDEFIDGQFDEFTYNINNQNIKRVEAFVWEKGTLRPLGKAKEVFVN